MPSKKVRSGCLLLLLGSLMLVGASANAQEVVVTDFPLGIGGSVNPSLFRQYQTGLQAVADTLHKYPTARAVIVGAADGERYRANNDAKNPGLALGRAHALREWLIKHYDVDSTQLVIQSKDVALIGPNYRSVSVRVVRESRPSVSVPDAQVVSSPQVLSHSEPPQAARDITEHMGLQVGGGLTTSPYGAIPFVSGAVTWKRIIFVEGTLGYTMWNGTFRFQGIDLETHRRMAGGAVIIYPLTHLPLGLVGGWARVEEISQAYYQYVRLSEGPILGLRTSLLDCITITGAYAPCKQRLAGEAKSEYKSSQFMLSVGVQKIFGGSQ